MVKLHIWRLVIVGLVAAVLATEAAAAEPTPPPKSDCPQECQRRAKAAFAFAKLKAEAKTPATAAPIPKPVAPKVGSRLCPCGDSCECAAGTCPACPAAKPAAIPAAARKVVGYYQVCDGRRCYWVPVYEP